MSCTLSQSLFGDCKNNKLFGGGIKTTVTLFKLPETKFYSKNGLNSLVIDELFSPNRYDIDISNLDYSLSVSDNSYVHKLSGKIYNLDGEIQKALFETENDRYIVVFRPKGEGLRGFGFSFGAVLSYSQVVGTDENSYSITLEEKSPYSLFELDYDIFNPNKEFSTVYTPSFGTCRVESGNKTGWLDYNAILAVNANGEALDRFGYKSSVSGVFQAGYFREGFDASDYDVLGRFDGDTVVIGGVSYKTSTFDPSQCEIEEYETFEITPSVVVLDSTNYTEAEIAIDCDSNWSVLDKEMIKYSELSEYSGLDGLSLIKAYNGKGGVDVLRIQDLKTLQIKTLTIQSYIIKIPFYRRTVGQGELSFSIPIESYGGDQSFTFSSTASPDLLSLVKDGDVLYGYIQELPEEDTVVEITIKHSNWPDEEKTIGLTILAPRGTDPQWTIVGAYCEVSE